MQGIRILFGTLLLLLAAGEVSKVTSQDKAPAQQPAFTYDSSTEVTIKGRIQEVKEYKCPVSGTVGSHITVKTEDSITEVHLAPASFLKDYEIVYKAGDEVKIIGVKTTVDGKPALLARNVTLGRETIAFRSDKGKPLW